MVFSGLCVARDVRCALKKLRAQDRGNGRGRGATLRGSNKLYR